MAPELKIDILAGWVVAQYRAQVIETEARADAGAPAWVYQVDFASRTEPRRGAVHTMDIPLAFGTLGAAGSQTGTAPAARAASQAMQDSFVSFVTNGDPNHAGAPSWSHDDRVKRSVMIFNARYHVALPDAQRAIRLIRSRAKMYGINPNRVAVMGFSAGGHVCGDLATRFAQQAYTPINARDRAGARPDVAALIYAVQSMTLPLDHPGSRALLPGP